MKIEKALHRDLKAYCTRGEWFRFPPGTKGAFHEATKRLYREVEGAPLEWFRISDKKAISYVSALRGLTPNPSRPRF